jgi:hypothetical protein
LAGAAGETGAGETWAAAAALCIPVYVCGDGRMVVSSPLSDQSGT